MRGVVETRALEDRGRAQALRAARTHRAARTEQARAPSTVVITASTLGRLRPAARRITRLTLASGTIRAPAAGPRARGGRGSRDCFVPRGSRSAQLPQSPQALARGSSRSALPAERRAPRRRIASLGGMWVDSADAELRSRSRRRRLAQRADRQSLEPVLALRPLGADALAGASMRRHPVDERPAADAAPASIVIEPSQVRQVRPWSGRAGRTRRARHAASSVRPTNGPASRTTTDRPATAVPRRRRRHRPGPDDDDDVGVEDDRRRRLWTAEPESAAAMRSGCGAAIGGDRRIVRAVARSPRGAGIGRRRRLGPHRPGTSAACGRPGGRPPLRRAARPTQPRR